MIEMTEFSLKAAWEIDDIAQRVLKAATKAAQAAQAAANKADAAAKAARSAPGKAHYARLEAQAAHDEYKAIFTRLLNEEEPDEKPD
jgi:hypothetical protein